MFTDFWGPLSIYPAIIIAVIALLAMFALAKINQFELQDVKYKAFDSLKGYLTIIVFISHSCTWYYYVRTDKWIQPNSNLYIQIGYTSISLFFMMTAFLFCNKLMHGKTNWIKLYVTRLVRLYPLYLIAVFILFFIAGCLSDFTLANSQSWIKLASQLERWLMFTIRTDPDINGVFDTRRIISGVTWTLRYEWIFYLALPTIGTLLFKNRPNFIALALSIVLITYMCLYWYLMMLLFAPFAGGILASMLSKQEQLTKLATHWMGSAIVLSLIGALIVLYSFSAVSTYDFAPLLITTLIFILITHGNTIFGFLSIRLARQLGQLSYGIYLFHGILFFTFFRFALGFDKAASLSTTHHWLFIFLLTPIIISISFFLHIYVEVPALKYAAPITDKVKGMIGLFKRQVVNPWNQRLHLNLEGYNKQPKKGNLDKNKESVSL